MRDNWMIAKSAHGDLAKGLQYAAAVDGGGVLGLLGYNI